MQEARLWPLKGALSAQKSPSRVQDGDKEVAGSYGREKYFPNEGSLICPPGKSMIFLEKKNRKKLVAGPELQDLVGHLIHAAFIALPG